MTVTFGFHGKVALVTGAASGIGQAAALAFAAAGASVVLADVDERGGEAVLETILQERNDALFVPTDVTDAGQVERLVARAAGKYGGLDCAFNNAGVGAGVEGEYVPAGECTEENWDRTAAVNLKGVWLCMRYEIPEMLRRGGGAIVNCASITGLVAGRDNPAYVASKHGVVGLTRSAAVDYARANIRVNAVCPGVIRTPMSQGYIAGRLDREERIHNLTPMGRLGRAEEVAAAVLWLCSDGASFVTGHPLPVDGGWVAS